jgi:hypothetical protein
MILLFNVKITQNGLTHYDRGSWLPKYDRVDVFKYCLASYAAMLPLITKCEFYIELAPEFKDRQAELEAYIKELFPADKLNLNWYRHYFTKEWREWCDRAITDDNEPIWFAGNDDHIFVDYNLDVLAAGLKHLKEDPNPLGQIYYSHWPEQMRLAPHHGARLTDDGNYMVRDWRTFDAITIMLGTRWKKYWFDQDWGDLQVWRTDPLWHIGYELTGPVYAATRELVRHYDGYSHTGTAIANIAPPLFIPPGFFENDIKVCIGYDQRDSEWTNLNPTSEWLYNYSPAGADYRWVLEDIPLFWNARISQFNISPDYDLNTMYQARDAAFIASTRIPMKTYSTVFDHTGAAPVEWFNNHLRIKG